MKKLLFFLFIIVLAVIAVPVVILIVGSGDTPVCTMDAKASYDSIQQVKDVVKRIKPENLEKKHASSVAFTEKELNLVLGYLLSYGLKNGRAASDLELADGRMRAVVCAHVPVNPLGNYFNMTVDFSERDNLLQIERIMLGTFEVPGAVVNPVVGLVHAGLMNVELYAAFFTNTENIKDISISDNRLQIAYKWNQEAIDQLKETGKNVVLPRQHQEMLVSYHNELARVLDSIKGEKTSLLQVLKPMFSFALEQSAASGKPVMENTALLQALATYSNNSDLSNFIAKDLAAQTRAIPYRSIYLNNRADLSRHFLISSGLAVTTNGRLADLIGVAKEVKDSDGGSGFSFADLAADRAGVKLGETATASEQQAAHIQQKMSTVANESSFMPGIDQLPEGISKVEFKNSLEEIDSKAYTLIKDELEKRLLGCSIYN